MNDEVWLYLSFVGDHKFLGGMYICPCSDDIFEDPLWQVELPPDLKASKMAVKLVPSGAVPQDHKWHNRLLSKQELEEATGNPTVSYGDLKKMQKEGVN